MNPILIQPSRKPDPDSIWEMSVSSQKAMYRGVFRTKRLGTGNSVFGSEFYDPPPHVPLPLNTPLVMCSHKTINLQLPPELSPLNKFGHNYSANIKRYGSHRMHRIYQIHFKFRSIHDTIGPRSSDPYYIVSSYIKRVTTSWTHII